MKIIEKGKKENGFLHGKRIHCPLCDSTMEIEAGDKINSFSKWHKDFNQYYVEVDCIVCKSNMWAYVGVDEKVPS